MDDELGRILIYLAL